MIPAFSVIANGDSALDIRFDAEPSEELSRWIIAIEQAINALDRAGIQDLIPAYQCLTLCFDPLLCDPDGLKNDVEALTRKLLARQPELKRNPRLIRLPVCYEGEFAQDMSAVSEHTGLSAQQITAKHCAPHYLVHMLGFSPGFLYLGGLDPSLHCPRKETPALRVPAGAVGIGGKQTGVYPQESPGGWQIIGRTPVELFRPHGNPAFVAEPLDRIEFYPIDRAQFEQFRQEMLEVIPLEQAS
ncbi:sensor histidine kinase inhibitor, KipI family [Microbulbifer donghaiensis]|uniref:Sensor histidine kinase inhibitor, KipI family n=1 Tax=Microbulbifer donghaiensis TaxID=494016 RepID=A0A1M5HT19_9GAMM|nr:5-oxoprolinase subunit PxpB [Microbulbifer donghaiensis]SHG19075.1 sensor histidine kinase inhibitor, KipI family [Microbulbifer donghaiensis]